MTFPSTLWEIGYRTFYDCKSLRNVAFREGSKLEKLGDLCFAESGLEEFVAPSWLREICDAAFWSCNNLRRVVLNEGLEELNDYWDGISYEGIFQYSGIREITLPSTLR